MREDFNLSDKIQEDVDIGMPEEFMQKDLEFISVKDVKEFIRRLKDTLRYYLDSDEHEQIKAEEFEKIINQFAGDKLI